MVWERRHYWTEIAAFATAARRGAGARADATPGVSAGS